jgi:predicted flap endonuclease-1-like 5' DNA nuclease
MTFTLAQYSTNEWAILLLVLILGILLGLLARGGAARYRREAEEERAARIEIERAYDIRIKAANERIAELERHAAPIGAGTAAAVGAAASGARDDLSLIRGVDRAGETRLNDLGVHRYRDITRLSADEEAALEGRMGLNPGTIAREEWREQAALLERDKLDEHRARYR